MSIIAPLNPIERAAATSATAAMFRNRPQDFAHGVTCIHLLRAQMTAFGYTPPAIPHFSTPIGAKRALRKMGHRDLCSLLDELLPRIPAARMRVGDIVLGEGAGLFDAIGISAGGKVLGWDEDGNGLFNITLTAAPIGAWALV